MNVRSCGISVGALVAFLVVIFCPLTQASDVGDLCEFDSVQEAVSFGWEAKSAASLEVTRGSRVGQSALRVEGADGMSRYGGINLMKEVDMSTAGPGDRISFYLKQNFSTGLCLNIDGNKYRYFNVERGNWTKVELDLDLDNWTVNQGNKEWPEVHNFSIYASGFNSGGEYLVLDGFSITLGGNELTIADFEPPSPARWEFPNQTERAWFLGNSEVAWAISKKTSRVIGGWNGRTKELYLCSTEGRYYVEDKEGEYPAVERKDSVEEAEFHPSRSQVAVTCTNPAVPELRIKKTYGLDGSRLVRKTAFVSRAGRPLYVTFNTEVELERAYRDSGYYMGGANGAGPLMPAPKLSAPKEVTAYRATTKGMMLSNSERGYSFAHYRTKLDDEFVFPWWACSIAGYNEKHNMLYYTPLGWEVSLGTSKIPSGGQTSYEEHFSIFPGDWYTFYTCEYPSLPEVQTELDRIAPAPDWLDDVKFYTGASGPAELKRLVDMTDEGIIMVLWVVGGDWADYYVDEGLVGYYDGFITGPELKGRIERIQAISPRIKVGIYNWLASTTHQSRILEKHPEWFRKEDKDGNPAYVFPGFAPNYCSMLNNPDCYEEILSQVDLEYSYLGQDFVYLDQGRYPNLINWQTGNVVRDDDFLNFYRDIKTVAARHGPDRLVFFNGRGNLYADVNFIEARSQLRAGYWRHFSGMGLGIEALLTARPRARIIPLYWTTPMARDYINRVLALGWIPSLAYGDPLGRRPYATAAYEMGNCTPVAARYKPDWKEDSSTKLESYFMRREGGESCVLSLISHADGRKTYPLTIDTGSIELDPEGQINVCLYRIEDGSQFQGRTTERFARRTYRKTGWKLDLVSRQELLYSGPCKKELKFDLELEPLQLYVLSLSSQPGAVYSSRGLPANFLFPTSRKVEVRGSVDRPGHRVDLRVKSGRDRAEITAFIPDDWQLEGATLNGRPVKMEWTGLSGRTLPVAKVPEGNHRLTFNCRANSSDPLEMRGLRVSTEGGALRVRLPEEVADAREAVLALTGLERKPFSRSVPVADGVCSVPLVAQRGGSYRVELNAGVKADGRVVLYRGAAGQVDLPARSPERDLPSATQARVPEEKDVRQVDRVINGRKVLRAATYTGSMLVSPGQPEVPPFMATAVPTDLTIEAGTTRNIKARGASFAGLEVEGMRRVKVKLENTYHDAFHIRGTGRHDWQYRRSTREFAGLMLHYHTAEGYARKVALGVGFMNDKCNTPFPRYGREGAPDQIIDLGDLISKRAVEVFSLDLARYAPEGWDGRVWFSVGSDWVGADRRLKATILGVNEQVEGDVITGTDPREFQRIFEQPRSVRVPKASPSPLMDGVVDDEIYQAAAELERFFLVGGKGWPRAGATAKLFYDDTHLYVGVICEEPGRRRPITGRGTIWNDDEVEILLDTTRDRKSYRQIIVNAAGDSFENSDEGTVDIGAEVAGHVEPGRRWSVEVAIPFRGLGVKPPRPGEEWGLNIARNRPSGADFNRELITWAPCRKGFKELENFGTLTFTK